MGKNLDPKCKQCRRIGEKLMLKGERCSSSKCAMVKKSYIPGFHGPKRRGMARKSDYGLQLTEKQKARKQYGLMEKQFKLTFNRASKKTGDIGENLLRLLELRLDNVIFKLGFADSRSEARQLVNHGHFEVNGKKVSIPSFQVKEGDTINIKKKSKTGKRFKNIGEKLKRVEAPGWLSLDKKEFLGKVLHEPKDKDLEFNINTQMIVEFYSK